jgi:hypothetical protein
LAQACRAGGFAGWFGQAAAQASRVCLPGLIRVLLRSLKATRQPTLSPLTHPMCAVLAQMILMQHKQRHHIITEYINNPANDRVTKPTKMSSFLQQFYKSN